MVTVSTHKVLVNLTTQWSLHGTKDYSQEIKVTLTSSFLFFFFLWANFTQAWVKVHKENKEIKYFFLCFRKIILIYFMQLSSNEVHKFQSISLIVFIAKEPSMFTERGSDTENGKKHLLTTNHFELTLLITCENGMWWIYSSLMTISCFEYLKSLQVNHQVFHFFTPLIPFSLTSSTYNTYVNIRFIAWL